MSTRPHPESERPMHDPLQVFSIEDEVKRLKGEKEWLEGRRNSITLRKGQGMSVVLLVMKAGDKLDEHTAPGPISFAVREGRARFTAAGETVEVGAESLLTCDAGVLHSVEAITDAVCLLTVTGSWGGGAA